jgi:hypothetical protein
MNSIRELLGALERSARARLTAASYQVRLPVEDAARLAALAEMYPRKTEEQLITELLAAALDELEAALPYLEGPRVVAEDELGDPIFEDLGPTRHFAELAQKHLRRLRQAAAAAE